MFRKLALLATCSAMVAAAGCRNDNNGGTPVDLTPGPGDMAVGGGGGDMAMKSYMMSSIAGMRQGSPGDYQLTNVVQLGRTPSKASPRIFVQDAGGGDFSAMMVKCSSTSMTHPCSAATLAAAVAIADGHSVTIQGTYIRSSSTKFEEFFIDTITDNGAGTAPAPSTVALTDIQRGGTSAKYYFQKVTTTLTTPWIMYDWTPTEFVYTGATKCPYQFGWGMVPMGTAGVTPGMSCGTSGSTQPASPTGTPPSSEILIGTDFYSGFTVSSDCRCAKMFTDTVPNGPPNAAAASTMPAGAVSGLLVFDVPYMGTTGYTYIAPQTNTDAPITNTVAGN
jgi:hypothetical protein